MQENFEMIYGDYQTIQSDGNDCDGSLTCGRRRNIRRWFVTMARLLGAEESSFSLEKVPLAYFYNVTRYK